jgi:hypothetical protein
LTSGKSAAALEAPWNSKWDAHSGISDAEVLQLQGCDAVEKFVSWRGMHIIVGEQEIVYTRKHG